MRQTPISAEILGEKFADVEKEYTVITFNKLTGDLMISDNLKNIGGLFSLQFSMAMNVSFRYQLF